VSSFIKNLKKQKQKIKNISIQVGWLECDSGFGDDLLKDTRAHYTQNPDEIKIIK
jgi:hypothetical protein